MYIGFPQLIYAGLLAWGFFYTTFKHGQLKEHKVGEKHDGVKAFVTFVIEMALLCWGGFFG